MQRHLEGPSDLQVKLANSLGDDSFHIAAARLYEAIWPAVVTDKSLDSASEKQMAFARDIGIDVSDLDKESASNCISARLRVMNEIALRDLDLHPGDEFILKDGGDVCRVSCVGRDRRVFPKGWGGQAVWATQILRKVIPRPSLMAKRKRSPRASGR